MHLRKFFSWKKNYLNLKLDARTHRYSWCSSWHFCSHRVKCWLPHGLKTITCTSFIHTQFLLLMINIVLIKNGICTLANIVIVNPIGTNLFPWSCTIQGIFASNAIQAKNMSYHDQHPIDPFLPLAIKVYGCLHKQINVFLHDCVNAIWILKRPKGLLFIMVPFFDKKFQSHCKGCKHLPS
jgi:hypothetical protein